MKYFQNLNAIWFKVTNSLVIWRTTKLKLIIQVNMLSRKDLFLVNVATITKYFQIKNRQGRY